jgi:hypothetical protein
MSRETKHLEFLALERIRRIMVEFEALQAAVPKLIQAYKDEVAKNADLTKQIGNPDPAPADVAALTTEITDVLNPPASTT